MNREDFFIKSLGPNQWIGDDAVILENMSISQDAFFENVHFKRAWMSLYEIAQKAMLVNISDAIVMNGRPKYALLTVAIPPSFNRRELVELARGFKETADEYGIQIVGGDTIANTKLDISITILAECPRPIFRTGIKEGDLLAYTGQLGQSAKDLQRLLRGGSVSPKSRFLHPRLRVDFFYRVARHIRSAMDISDGLFHDLEKLHRANRIGFRFLSSIPQRVGCSGEEFEILFAFDPRKEAAVRAIARATRTPLTIFAQAVRNSYRNICDPHHF